MDVEFDIAWNYSWRLSTEQSNWDAVWVFMKFKNASRGSGEWQPGSLLNTGHTAPNGSEITTGLINTATSFNIATNPGVGVFIYRSAAGSGSVDFNDVKLRWDYEQDGVVYGDDLTYQIHAIHMVYVPDGAFYAGDNNTSTSSFKQGSADNDPWYITSESAITTSSGSAEYYDATGYTIPAAFPKGYGKFYLMRHEITQEQWRDFFNSLP
ncbi:MAG: hypothetical protein NTV65_11260, partial [Proteobacteria bacterium]|nr:hypothetical protein [Pseudomonadota bacterium]